jgi:hypothetical protein
VRYGLGAYAALVALGAGCAVTAKAERPDQGLDATSSYVFGRFVIKASPSAFGEMGRAEHQTVGLVLQCDDGATYPLLFSAEWEVRVVKLRPASCVVKEIQYVDDLGIVLGRKEPPAKWVHLNYFAPGHGYYLGDFFAVASLRIIPGYPWAKRVMTWDMDPVDDRFEQTAVELRQKFAGLAALPIHDQRLAPGRSQRKKGLAGADEPLMSPERIARLAGFIGRTYRTPAACEAACLTGDCLPYRAAAGPAMACIVHCTTNRDCAEGMVCNCSHHAGPDCRSVAETPGDAMEGICMSELSSAGRCGR